MRTILTALTAVTILSTSSLAQDRAPRFSSSLGDPVLYNATVKVERELMLPAQDNGLLVELGVKKGDIVEEGAYLGKIDDTEAIMAQTVARAQLQTAEKNAGEGSDIQIKYAVAAADVAKVEYEQKLQARNAVTTMEIERARLEWQRADAQTAVRQLEKELANYEVDAKKAELYAATKALERRRLVAPFAGIVEDTYRRAGEWVQAGEPILRLMDFTTMAVTGQVDAERYSRQDVVGRPVTVLVTLAHGEQVELQGTVTVVSPLINALEKEFAVEARVPNQTIGNHWVLSHGDMVTMTIHVN